MATINFYETDHCKLLVVANRFLLAANVLRHSSEYKNTKVLFKPTLHLTAHGIEVLLKANLVGSGFALEDIRKQYGHEICGLWDHDKNRLLRGEAFVEARKAWEQAQGGSSWQDTFNSDPEQLLEEYLRAISALHTRESEYALRYIAAPEIKGPRPHLLLDTFLPIADLCMRQPSVLLVS